MSKLIKILEIPKIETDGILCFMQSPDQIPFDINRVYFIENVSEGAVRGAHTHKECIQVLFCIKGEINIVLDNGKAKEKITLNEPNKGLVLEPKVWHEMQDFKKDTVILVLASEKYDSDDYVRDYEDFLTTIYNDK